MKKRKVAKRIFLILLSVIVVFCIFNYKWVEYGIGQARGQFHIISNARPVGELLKDPLFPDSLKSKLPFLDSVKRYSYKNLGLANSSIYSSVYDQKGEPVMYVVLAAEPFKMESHEWEIPLAGSFPYLGFFKLEKAIAEKERLAKLGYDTRIRTVDGWSTLGFLDNPLLSDNLGDPLGQLANLIIHEISHETVYLRDSTTVNENLASFIADAGTSQMLREWYGDSSKVYLEYKHYISDYDRFAKHMLRGAKYLKETYEGFEQSHPDTLEMKARKTEAIRLIVNQLDTVSFYDTTFRYTPFRENLPDNSFFTSFIRYRSNLENYYDTLFSRYNGNLKMYVEGMKKW